jgi:hypothetical protein
MELTPQIISALSLLIKSFFYTKIFSMSHILRKEERKQTIQFYHCMTMYLNNTNETLWVLLETYKVGK